MAGPSSARDDGGWGCRRAGLSGLGSASAEGCGVDLTGWEVVDYVGHAHPLVQAAFTEGDASCAAACDGATGACVVVVGGGTSDLPICRQVYPEC